MISLLTRIAENNIKTKNFNVIILYFLSTLHKMRLKAYEGDWHSETINILLSIRIVIKWMAQNKVPQDIVDIMERKI